MKYLRIKNADINAVVKALEDVQVSVTSLEGRISVNTPTHWHREMAKKALEAARVEFA